MVDGCSAECQCDTLVRVLARNRVRIGCYGDGSECYSTLDTYGTVIVVMLASEG